MVNSCTGKMGHATAEAIVRAGLSLVPYTICGTSQGVAVGSIGISGIPVERVTLENRVQVLLIPVLSIETWYPMPGTPDKREIFTTFQPVQVMQEVKGSYPGMIIVDYSLPSAVNSNAQFYCEQGVPFVMGTTGGDRAQLLSDTMSCGIHAVIAPQMGKQVVAFQAMMQNMAAEFPGSFSGYTLEVVESHQRTKADTSGTAKAVVESFRELGVADFNVSDIQKVRMPRDQVELMHVPEQHLDGHAFHTYRLRSPDHTVTFEFQHNVCGRGIYAEGTVDAVLFLHDKIKQASEQKVFTMIDVLRGGKMR